MGFNTQRLTFINKTANEANDAKGRTRDTTSRNGTKKKKKKKKGGKKGGCRLC